MSDSTVFAIASGKGGVGKSTLTINLGAALASRGRAVVVVDADLGMANLGTMLDISTDGPTLLDVLANSAKIQEATYQTSHGFAIVPSGTSLEEFGDAETETLGSAIDSLRGAFDVVLLDTGAGLSHDAILPLGIADSVILVATPDLVSIENVAKSKELTKRMETDIAGVVLTRTGSQYDLNVKTVGKELEELVLALIPEDESVGSSLDRSAPVVRAYPKSPAAIGYAGLAGYLDGDTTIQIPIQPPPGTPIEADVIEPSDDLESAPEDEPEDPENDESDAEESESDSDGDDEPSLRVEDPDGEGNTDESETRKRGLFSRLFRRS